MTTNVMPITSTIRPFNVRLESESILDYLGEVATAVRCHPTYSYITRDVLYQKELVKAVVFFAQSKILFLFTGKGDQNDNSSIFNHPEAAHWAGRAKFLGGVITGVVSLYIFITQAIEVGTEHEKIRRGGKRYYELSIAVLKMLDGIAGLAISVATIAMGLSMAGIVGVSVASWAPFLMMAGTALTVVQIATDILSIKHGRSVYEKLDNSNTQEALDWLYHELNNTETGDGEEFLYRHFEIIGTSKYKEIACDIIRNGTVESKVELLADLKKRIKEKEFCHKLSILVIIIGLIGMSFFLFPGAVGMVCPIIDPSMTGYSLLTLSSLLAVGRYYRNKRSVNRLESNLIAASRSPSSSLRIDETATDSFLRRPILHHVVPAGGL